MAITSGPLAPLTAAILVLSESSTIFTILSKTFLIEDALVDTFDGVLISKNTIDLVSGGREIKRGGTDPIGKLGKLVKKPFAKFTPKALIRYLMYLPLNFIPLVGTAVFVVLQGRRVGPAAHTRYFQLKGWNNSQKEEHVEKHKAAYTRLALPPSLPIPYPYPYTYTKPYRFFFLHPYEIHIFICIYLYSFGIATVLLELVPLASIFFAFTSTVGAALWAVDLEKGNVNSQGTAPNLREQAKKAE